jgi:aspartate racemase
MRTIGLIGGMSWESTRLYYDAINVAVRERLGGLHSARCILYSVDFAPIARMQADGDWEAAAEALVDAARSLERAGADCIGLCTNTMHKIADRIVAGVRIPFIHIAETTADAIKAAGMRRPYLMATRFTMEQDFYTGMLRARGLDVIVPDAAARAEVHRIIYDELCRGEIKDSSRATYVTQTRTAKDLGADCVILGCTEVGMLLSNENSALPTFDTTRLHALRLVDFALGHAAQQVR